MCLFAQGNREGEGERCWGGRERESFICEEKEREKSRREIERE